MSVMFLMCDKLSYVCNTCMQLISSDTFTKPLLKIYAISVIDLCAKCSLCNRERHFQEKAQSAQTNEANYLDQM